MMTSLQQSVFFVLALIIALDIHEFFHAWIALQLGDPTAKYMGRVTLNPIAHLDPLGAIMMVVMSFAHVGFGWGKPVPINPNNLRRGPIVGGAIVSVCGPISNLLLAAIVAVPLRLSLMSILPLSFISTIPGYFLQVLLLVNISLALFNLLPIPPLDGYHFWLGLLHEIPSAFTRRLWMSLSSASVEQAGPMLLLLFIFLIPGALGRIMNPFFDLLLRLFLGV
jgi:Zn-dependent protease